VWGARLDNVFEAATFSITICLLCFIANDTMSDSIYNLRHYLGLGYFSGRLVLFLKIGEHFQNERGGSRTIWGGSLSKFERDRIPLSMPLLLALNMTHSFIFSLILFFREKKNVFCYWDVCFFADQDYRLSFSILKYDALHSDITNTSGTSQLKMSRLIKVKDSHSLDMVYIDRF